MTRSNERSRYRSGAGPGRYTPLLRDPSDPGAGWVVWDSRRQRCVRGLFGVRVFRGRHAAERADTFAYERYRRD